MSKSLFSVRNKKHAKHPYVVVGANRTKFNAMSLEHNATKKKSKGKGYNKNFPLLHNPNPNDKEPSYLRKQVISDFKFNFSKAFKNYKISDEDAKNILDYLENKKKK